MGEHRESSVQELFKELEEVIASMEKDDISLEDSFALYKNGMDLLKSCNQQIEKIEKQILLIDEEGEIHDFQ